jgi:hypothetical protein
MFFGVETGINMVLSTIKKLRMRIDAHKYRRGIGNQSIPLYKINLNLKET